MNSNFIPPEESEERRKGHIEVIDQFKKDFNETSKCFVLLSTDFGKKTIMAQVGSKAHCETLLMGAMHNDPEFKRFMCDAVGKFIMAEMTGALKDIPTGNSINPENSTEE